LIPQNPRGFLCGWMLMVIAIGVAIRFSLGLLLTYNYDVYSWALIISNIQAGSGLYETAGYNYPPVWGYFLAIMAQFTDLLGVDVLSERFPELIYTESAGNIFPHLAYVTTIGFNAVVTATITVFDILTGYVIYITVRDVFGDNRKALLCSAVWMLCPFVIVICAVAGMFDCICGMMTLLSILLMIKEKELLAGMVLCTAVLLKLFPAFIFFIFIGYIVLKHREELVKRIGKLVLGIVIIAAVIMLPHIMSGHIADSFSFITSRVSETDLIFGILTQYGSMITYIAIVILEIALAVVYVRKGDNSDKTFILYAFIGALLTFIYPATPQYVLFLAPLLIVVSFCIESQYRTTLFILMVGTTIFSLSSNVVDLTSVVMYTDLMSFETWQGLYSWSQTKLFGVSFADLISVTGGVIQYAAFLVAFMITIMNFRKQKSNVPDIDTSAE